ncbi:hypothetical protein BRC79_01895 [Halobacteriales archaeon QH_8_67_27]|nr:MAG: hypothetical protein BRC79_01895 [Halobacteriales archaeon QH_8_67_27]
MTPSLEPSGLHRIPDTSETRDSRWGSRLPSAGTTRTELRRRSSSGSYASVWTATRVPSGETATATGRVRS